MKKVIPIIKLATKLSEVKRTIGYKSGHYENDSEHSYQLALACWSANEQYEMKLDNELILKLALVHDLLEVYSGDTDAHDDPEKINSKSDRERKAIEALRKDYSEFEDILNTIKIYEEKTTKEAKLVNFLDKIVPDINIYNSNSNYYKDRKVTLDGWESWILSKIKYDTLSDKMKKFVDESISIIKNDLKDIFYKE